MTLYEAAEELGGQLRLWAKAPLTREFAKTLAWYEGQLTRLQVRVRRGEPLGAGDLAGLEADALVLATGSRPRAAEPLEGEAASPILRRTTWEVMADPPRGQHVLLCDEGGGRGGLSAVDVLLDDNRVTILSSDFAVAELVNPNIRTPLYKRFLKAGAVFRPNEVLLRLAGRRAETRNIYSDQTAFVEEVDILVDWRGNEVQAGLLTAAEALGLPAVEVGDCVAPRQLNIAISEGALAARRI